MDYHCPKCRKELIKEDYTGKEKWLIGPLFAQLIKHLRCREHGYIDFDELSPEERRVAVRNKWIGIVGGLLFYVVIIFLILLAYRMNY
ncbi:MAG TPA: hypothetical protein PLW67_11920 [Prolixibacteraceae bacterium]|nr:hypothetical protein [Prolixibacteraceae bacterium]